MPSLLGYSATFGGDAFDEGGYNYQYFDPLEVLATHLPEGDPIYDFWCHNCGSVWEPTLINVTTLNETPTPVYPCFTGGGLVGAGGDLYAGISICEAARLWLYSIWWSEKTGLPEYPECGPNTMT